MLFQYPACLVSSPVFRILLNPFSPVSCAHSRHRASKSQSLSFQALAHSLRNSRKTIRHNSRAFNRFRTLFTLLPSQISRNSCGASHLRTLSKTTEGVGHSSASFFDCTAKSFRMCSYARRACNPFRIRSYEKHRGGGTPCGFIQAFGMLTRSVEAIHGNAA